MKKFIINYWPLLSLITMALAVRLLAWLFTPGLPVSSDWTNFYHPAAAALAQGGSFGSFYPALNVAPLYILYLSIFYRLFGIGVFAMRAGHLLLDVLIMVQIYFFGTKLFSKKAAILAVTLYALYPTVIYMSGLGQPEVLLAFTLMMAVCIWHYADRKNSWGAYLILGIFFGLSVLIKPNYFGFLPFWILWESIFSKDKKKSAKMLSAVILGFLMMVAPWFLFRAALGITNLSVFEAYAKIIYCGTALRPSLADGMMPLQSFYQQQMQIIVGVTSQADIFKHIFERWGNLFWPNPFKALEFLLLKFYQIWHATDAGNIDKFFRYFQMPFMVLAILGLLYSARNKETFLKQKSILLIVFYTILALMMITPLHREMLPIMPILFLYVSSALFFFFRKLFPQFGSEKPVLK